MTPSLPTPPATPAGFNVPMGHEIANQALSAGLSPYPVNPIASALNSSANLVDSVIAHRRAQEEWEFQQGQRKQQLMMSGVIPWDPNAIWKHYRKAGLVSDEMLKGPTPQEIEAKKTQLQSATPSPLTAGMGLPPGAAVQAQAGSAAAAQPPTGPVDPSQLPGGGVPGTSQQPSVMQRLGLAPWNPQAQPGSPADTLGHQMMTSYGVQRALAMMKAQLEFKYGGRQNEMLDLLGQHIGEVENGDTESQGHMQRAQLLDQMGLLKEPENSYMFNEAVLRGHLDPEQAWPAWIRHTTGQTGALQAAREAGAKDAMHYKSLQAAVTAHVAAMAPWAFDQDHLNDIRSNPYYQRITTPEENVSETDAIAKAASGLYLPRDKSGNIDPALFDDFSRSVVGSLHGDPASQQSLARYNQAFGSKYAEYLNQRDQTALNRDQFYKSTVDMNNQTRNTMLKWAMEFHKADTDVVYDLSKPVQVRQQAAQRIFNDLAQLGPQNSQIMDPKTGTLKNIQWDPTRLDFDRFFNLFGPSNGIFGAENVVNDPASNAAAKAWADKAAAAKTNPQNKTAPDQGNPDWPTWPF